MRRALSARSIVCATCSGGTPRLAVSARPCPSPRARARTGRCSSGGIAQLRVGLARLLSQIGVAPSPARSARPARREVRSSTRSASPIASIACLEAAYGADERHRHAPADGGDEHDPPGARAQRRQQRLCDGDLTEDVDLELLAQVVAWSSSSGPPKPTPALLTSASSRPGQATSAARPAHDPAA